MDIKLFSLYRGNPSGYSEPKKIIADCANYFTNQSEKFKNFSSPKRLLIAASQALRSADCVIIAVQSSAYNTVKKMICSTFGVPVKRNEEVYSLLLPLFDNKKISESALENSSLFPANADIFEVSDYKYCGFSVTAGAQSIIVLPLDYKLSPEAVYDNLYDYLGELAGVENPADIAKLKRFRICAGIVNLLKKENKTLTFSSLGGVPLIEESIRTVDEERKFISLGDKPQPRTPSQSAKEYIISTVQKTRELAKTDYACAVSSVFASNSDDSVFSFAAVADKNATYVTKLFAAENEAPKAFSAAAVEKMMFNAGEKIFFDIQKNKEENSKKEVSFRRKLTLVSSVSVGVATALSAVLALLLK